MPVGIDRQKHVRGRDVAVDDAAVVGVRQRRQDGNRDRDGLRGGERSAAMQVPFERLSPQELHDEDQGPVVLVDEIEDANDAPVREHRAQARLVPESQRGVVARRRVEPHLDGDLGPRRPVAGNPHFAHAARADAAHEAVLAADNPAGFRRARRNHGPSPPGSNPEAP